MRALYCADRVVEPMTRQELAPGAVLVEDGLITWVGRNAEAPTVDEVVSLPGHTLLPGFIDAHVHLWGARGYSFETGSFPHRDMLAVRASIECRALLDAGFTTVRDCGSPIALTLRDLVADGTIAGPTIVAAGPIVCQTGGHADIHSLPLEEAKRHPLSAIADGPWACRSAVREIVREGADFIKICTTGGIGSQRDHPNDVHFTAEEIRALVDEAHRSGRRVAAHAQGKDGVLAAVRGGVDSIEHGYYLDEECLDAMLARGTALVPTLALKSVFERTLANPAGLPPWRARKQAEAVEAMGNSFRLAVSSGVLIATGSDFLGAPLREHGQNVDEPIAMVREGMTTWQALQALTCNAARVLGKEDSLGRLEAGWRADLVAVEGNPLTDINQLRQVALVVQAGRIAKQEGL